MREIVKIRVYFLHPVIFLLLCTPAQVAPFDQFSCFMAQSDNDDIGDIARSLSWHLHWTKTKRCVSTSSTSFLGC